MTPEQARELDAIFYLGAFVAVVVPIFAAQVFDKLKDLKAILERMGPKP